MGYCVYARLTFGKRIAAFRRLGFRKTPFGLAPSAVFCSSTFLLLLERFVFLYRNSKNFIYRRNDIAASFVIS
jgi:hypothetical protein